MGAHAFLNFNHINIKLHQSIPAVTKVVLGGSLTVGQQTITNRAYVTWPMGGEGTEKLSLNWL